MAKINNILITGSLGFVGFHLSKKLLSLGHKVIGIDNINSYYDKNLKLLRKKEILKFSKKSNFLFYKLDISNKSKLTQVFKENKFNVVIHLAAQAGVRYSIKNPDTYVSANLTGFFNILECCRLKNVKHLIFASSSSIYGSNKKIPFKIDDKTDKPISLYAATKKSNELMAYSYSHLYGIPITGLRFFTVYGTFGRPDMAYFSFTRDIFLGKKIRVFNNGKMKRDFTHVDDIVEGINEIIYQIPKIKKNDIPYRVLNFGSNKPINLEYLIKLIEKSLKMRAKKIYLPMQPGDVATTFADMKETNKIIKTRFNTRIEDGISQFVDWYLNYYNK